MPEKGSLLKPLPPHGTVARYRHRVQPCKTCDLCKRAWADYIAEYRARRREAWTQEGRVSEWLQRKRGL